MLPPPVSSAFFSPQTDLNLNGLYVDAPWGRERTGLSALFPLFWGKEHNRSLICAENSWIDGKLPVPPPPPPPPLLLPSEFPLMCR